MEILEVTPRRGDVLDLLTQSQAYMDSLYPPDSNHIDGPTELSKTNAYLVGAFISELLVGIGAVKCLSDDEVYGEIKRVFVSPDYRGKGVSRRIMVALESYVIKKGISVCRLETGVKQPEAPGLYKKIGYQQRRAFGSYDPDPLSVFMEKALGG